MNGGLACAKKRVVLSQHRHFFSSSTLKLLCLICLWISVCQSSTELWQSTHTYACSFFYFVFICGRVCVQACLSLTNMVGHSKPASIHKHTHTMEEVGTTANKIKTSASFWSLIQVLKCTQHPCICMSLNDRITHSVLVYFLIRMLMAVKCFALVCTPRSYSAHTFVHRLSPGHIHTGHSCVKRAKQ